MTKLDISAIVEHRVKERLNEIHWSDLLTNEIEDTVDVSVDSAENFWINSIRRYREKLEAHYKALQGNEFKDGAYKYTDYIFSAEELNHPQAMAELNLNVDMKKKEMTISTVATTTDGLPMFEKVIKGDGTIIDTIRVGDAAPEDDLEAQRDIAIKVILFFLGFILLCVGLLYAYHKMQKNQQQNQKANL